MTSGSRSDCNLPEDVAFCNAADMLQALLGHSVAKDLIVHGRRPYPANPQKNTVPRAGGGYCIFAGLDPELFREANVISETALIRHKRLYEEYRMGEPPVLRLENGRCAAVQQLVSAPVRLPITYAE